MLLDVASNRNTYYTFCFNIVGVFFLWQGLIHTLDVVAAADDDGLF